MNQFTHAIVRKPGDNFAQGLTTSCLGPPDYETIVQQHRAYVRTLEALGLKIIYLPAEPGFPDAYFVEDTAVVTPHVAIIARPGAVSRQGEEKTIEAALAPYRSIERIESPGTLDGGDVLMMGNCFYIGVSARTNQAGADQLSGILRRYGHEPHLIQVADGLHLKSSLNSAGRETLILTESFSSLKLLDGYDKIIPAENEAYAANTLFLNHHLIMPAGFPKLKQRLESLPYPVIELDVSEVRKMDGGLTCLSIRF
jgi:dimethylargininase